MPAEKAPDWESILAGVDTGSVVYHKKFGRGVMNWRDKAHKYVLVRFESGEKAFSFPNAFIDGFLCLEETVE